MTLAKISLYCILKPTNSEEVKNIISNLNKNKSTGPNSLPTKILKLLKNYIFSQLADILNISFSSGTFPSQLEIAKIIPIYKTESKLILCICVLTIDQYLYHQTLIRFYKNLCIAEFMISLTKADLSTPYNLVFVNTTHLLMSFLIR